MSSFYYHQQADADAAAAAAAAAAVAGGQVPHINIDDQLETLESAEWHSTGDILALHPTDEQSLSLSYFAKDPLTNSYPHLPHSQVRPQYHRPQQQQQLLQRQQLRLAHQAQPAFQQQYSLDRFVFSDINESPFALGLAFQSPAPVVGHQFDPYSNVAWGYQDVPWAAQLGSPADPAFSCAPGNLYFPAGSLDTNSNQTADSAFSRASTSPVSDYYHSGRSPSLQTAHNAYLPSTVDSCSNDGSSCVALREVQTHPDMTAGPERTPSIDSMGATAFSLAMPRYAAPQGDLDGLHETDADVEVRAPDTNIIAYENVAMADEVVDSDTEAAETYGGASPPDSSDSEYKPTRKPRANRDRTSRTSGGASRRRPTALSADNTTSKVVKRPQPERHTSSGRMPFSRKASGAGSSTTSTATSATATSSLDRPFTCPLLPYGCTATFASKNEWKRHFTIQHVALGFFQCDLCPAGRPNTFNRKDLFKQHLRRMHRGERDGHPALVAVGDVGAARRRSAGASSATTSLADEEAFESELEAVRVRCWTALRAAPTRLACVFCSSPPAATAFVTTPADERPQFLAQVPVDVSMAASPTAVAAIVSPLGRTFEGPSCCDEWLEHVGRHLAAAAAAARDGRIDPVAAAREVAERWAADVTLRTWLVSEGIVETAPDGSLTVAGATAAQDGANAASAASSPVSSRRNRRRGGRDGDAAAATTATAAAGGGHD